MSMLVKPRELSQSSRTILVVGVESQIGAALFEKLCCQESLTVFGTSRRKEKSGYLDAIIHLDLCDPSFFIEKNMRFDHVVFCAGLTGIAECESDVFLCHQINVINTGKLIQFFSDCGSHVVFLSSNAVFDGSKPFFKITDKTSPITNYGKSKVEIETRFQNDSNIAILRLTKVITTSTPFIRRWIEQLDRSESITAYEDCYLSPIDIGDVILNIELLIKQRSHGIFHHGGIGEISYFDYAQTFFSGNYKALNLIEKVTKYDGVRRLHDSLATYLPYSIG